MHDKGTDARRVPPAEDFTSWLNVHGDALARYSFLIVGDHNEAQDVLQSALLSTFKSWTKIVRDVDDVPGYVRRAIVNERTNHWRKRLGQNRVRNKLGRRRDDTTPPVLTEDSDLLFGLLSRLSVETRACLVLRFYVDLSYAQIASELHIKQTTARSRVSRGLQQLRTLIEDEQRCLAND